MSHVDPFNSLGGFSVGIPPELVIDETGNVINNVNAPNANVTANRVYSNAYYWANGVPFVPNASASGSNTQVQFNNNGNFGASSAFTFNSATSLLTVSKLQIGNSANLGNVANVIILGGTNGYFLQTDGTGNLTWAPSGNGGGSNGNPGGANTQVQFNDAGSFGGDAGFTYNKIDNTLSVSNTIAAGNSITAVNLAVTDATVYNNVAATNIIASNITLSANVTNASWIFASYFAGNGHNLFGLVGANVVGQVGFANVANNVAGANVSGQVNFANVANNVAGANVSGQVGNSLVAGTVYTNAQPNITSVGNLTSLTVIGNTTLGNQVTANYFIGNLFGLANLARNVTLPAQPNITSLGTLTGLTVTGTTTLGNTVTGNYFIGNLYGVANSATIANTANLATLANNATLANAANLAGTVTVNAQPNITSLGTLTSLTVNGTSNLGPAGNVKITGGTNGYVLSTDGTGNLSWVAGGGGGGNGTPAGSNTQLQFNNAGDFGASPNLIFNSATNVLLVTGNAVVSNVFTANTVNSNTVNANNIAITSNLTVPNINSTTIIASTLTGSLKTNNQPNINYLGNLGWLNVDTNIAGGNGNITFNGSLTGSGAASNIFITGNVNAGNYVEANYFVGKVATNAQPYITSLGNLTSLNVVGLSNLGNVGNIKILGGTNGYVLSTDGAGNLSWINQGGGNALPGGSNTQVQYNSNGAFAGNSNFTFNDVTSNLNVNGNTNVNGIVRSITYVSTVATGSAPLQVNSTTPVANLAVDTAGTVRTGAQPNITSVGTLTSLAVTGNTTTGNLSVTNTFVAGNITTTGIIGTTNLNVTGTANFSNTAVVSGSGTLTINGKFNSAGSSNVNLGSISNIHISGGINGYVLATDGNANLYWTAGGGGGGNGTPGGSNTQIQYNNNGVFAGSPFLTFNNTTNNVQVAGNLIANSITMGAGIYQFSQANVFFATTTSDSADQPILSIDADGVAAVDYTIISTENAGNIRNLVKVSTVIYGNVVNYVEYSTLPVNGYIGDFTVSYDPGDIVNPPTIQLRLSPQTANLMQHKIMVTRYNE